MINDKRKVVFIIHQLTHGGVQHSLFKVLDHVDYDTNDVTLLILYDRLDLIDEIHPKVKKIVCKDKHNYEKHIPALFMCFLGKICKVLGLNKAQEKLREKEASYVYNKKYKYINKNYIKTLPKYDVAVSYIHGYPSIVAAEYIKADKKIMFYHTSIDEVHNVHEKIINKYDKIIVGNTAIADVVKEAYPQISERVGILKYFIGAKNVRTRAKEENVNFDDDCVNIVSCGRLSHEKGYDLAVGASAILAKNNIKFHWYFVGDGPMRESLEKQIQDENIENYITITGFKSNPFPYVKECDIFVQPSYFDANPLSMEEAKILCKPIVSTKTLGGKFMIEEGETGLTSEINAEDLAKQIRFLIEHPETMAKIIENLEQISYEDEDEEYMKEIEQVLSR